MFDKLQILQKEMGARKKPVPFPFRTIEQTQFYGEQYQPESKFLFNWLYLTGQRITEALRTKRFDVSIESKEGKEVLVVQSLTLKNKLTPRRILPLPFYGKEKPMVEYLWSRLQEITDNSVIFKDLTRTNAYNWLATQVIEQQAVDTKKKQFLDIKMAIYPHYLRHCRASHLAMFHGYDLVKLMQYFGWSTPAVASVYVSLNWQSLVEPMLKGD